MKEVFFYPSTGEDEEHFFDLLKVMKKYSSQQDTEDLKELGLDTVPRDKVTFLAFQRLQGIAGNWRIIGMAYQRVIQGAVVFGR